MPRACISCDFFAATNQNSCQCRKGSPQLVIIPPPPGTILAPGQVPSPMLMGTWPPTQPSQWCGEWKQRRHAPSEDGARLEHEN